MKADKMGSYWVAPRGVMMAASKVEMTVVCWAASMVVTRVD